MPYVDKIVTMHVMVWLISGVASGILSGIIAMSKGQSAIKWFFMGIIAPFASILGIAMTDNAEGTDFRVTERAHTAMRRAYAALVTLIAFLVYAQTAQPTVSFWDCGEFIACSYTLGVPHPPGAPLFLLIGRLVALLPLDFLAPLWGLEEMSVSLKINLMTGFSMALAVGVIFLIIARFAEKMFIKANTASEHAIVFVAGMVGALMTAFASTYWFNAVEATVYGPAMLISALAVYLAMLWYEKRDKPNSDRYLVFIPFLLYIGIGFHLMVMIMLPAIMLFLAFASVRLRKDPVFWLTWAILFSVATLFRIFLGTMVIGLGILFVGWLVTFAIKGQSIKTASVARSFGIGFITVLFCAIAFGLSGYTLIRSQQDPFIDENNPETIEEFANYMDRKQYGQESMWESMFSRRGQWRNQLGTHPRMGFWGFFQEQWSTREQGLNGILPFAIALLGLFLLFPKHKQFWLLLFLALLVSTLGLIIYLNFSDGTRGVRLEVRDRDYFFTAGYMFFSAWIGLGIGVILALLNQLRRKVKLTSVFTLILCAIMALLPVIPLHANWHIRDRSGNFIPFDYAYNILNSCAPNSILFTNGDNDTFPLWCLQAVKGIRTDVCIANLSLLNTPWYIKQLKTRTYYDYVGVNARGTTVSGELEAENEFDLKRKLAERNINLVSAEVARRTNQFGHDFVNIRMTDEQIDMLRAYRTSDGRVVRVQDIMIKHLVDNAKVTAQFDTVGERIDTTYSIEPPIYFAVTVSNDNKLNYEPFLRMEGLAYRLTGTRGERQVEPDIMREFLFNKYLFRSLKDETIYLDENSEKLLTNYTTSFMTLALDLRNKGRLDEAEEVIDKAVETLPFHEGIAMFGAQIYTEADEWEKFDKLVELSIEAAPANARMVRLFSDICFQVGDTTRTLQIMEKARERSPDNDVIFKSFLGYLYAFGMVERFNEEIIAWHDKHPEDEEIARYFENIRRAQAARTPAVEMPETSTPEEIVRDQETEPLPDDRPHGE
ncbi:MAG TPA: DUF2723 domain-containing protein [candidate division Zixibacteria bacterium]|mgnify:CR=1 FL=1|nr:DUF2723 domain-containing protein [candidate division Zixibacteria bacterium]